MKTLGFDFEREDLVVLDETSRIVIDEFAMPDIELADMNGDGVFDATDIFVLAEVYDLPLLPEFRTKLRRLEAAAAVGDFRAGKKKDRSRR